MTDSRPRDGRDVDALQRSEERFRVLIEQAMDITTVLDAEGTITYESPSVERVLGYRPAELIGRKVFEFIHPDDLPDVTQKLAEGLRLGNTVRVAELRFRHRDGSWRVLESIGRNLLAHPAVQGAVVNSRDITERKRAEEALRLLTTALESAANAVVITDASGSILWVNPAFTAVTGYTAAEAIGQSPRLLASGQQDPSFYRSLWETILAGEVWHGEIVNRHRDGHLYTEEMTITPVRARGRDITHFIAIKQDVTARKLAVETQARLETQLAQTEKLANMGQLLAGVAHELNNPLAVVLGRAALLADRLGGGSLAAQAQTIVHAAERCARVVRNFLALARQHPPERRRVSLNQIVEGVAELLAYPLRVDSVEPVLDLAPDLPALWADPNQLHQVVVNLVTNAHQAMRETPPPRRLVLATRHDVAAQLVTLEVTDSGPGIPPEVQARIFEPFFTTKAPGQGTGLGLSLCHGIVAEHGGSIWLASRPERGATFIIELPLTAVPEAVREAPGTGPVAGQAPKTILVVDDEPEVARLLQDVLGSDGHRVEIACNGTEALVRIAERTYDLVLSDLKMPGLDGPGLYRELQRRGSSLVRQFIFLTGDGLSPETRDFLERSGRPSLSKPFEVKDVRRIVQDAARGPLEP